MNQLASDLILLGLFGGLVVIGVYAFVIQPRQSAFRKRVQYVTQELTPGTEVTTYGGVIGKVVSVDPAHGTAQVEIADGVIVKMLVAAIMGEYDREAVADSAKKAQR